MDQFSYNPDVLSCLANLSNDEVFTPPELAKQILDKLPHEIWRNKDIKFLDPFCKSGVFLREIARRLLEGLEKVIPDQQERINHIFTNQLFGIAITELTALLSRRSVYCSKTANGKYSVCPAFTDKDGNIRFRSIKHSWSKGKCTYCGASEVEHERDLQLESHAYEFIHSSNPQQIFKGMKFDVVVGNPPYQLNDGGGTGSSAKPIYNLFVDRAMKLNPRFLTMIIPSRWYSGGKGLDEFREKMLNDDRIRKLVDFVDSRDCFPGVDIAGGVCYFLWDRDSHGPCEITTIRNGSSVKSVRGLNEFGNFVRDNVAVDIIKKVKAKSSEFLEEEVSSRNPFGLGSAVKPEKKGNLLLIASSGEGKIPEKKLTSGKDLIEKWKVLLSKASNDHGGQPDKEGKRRIFSRVEIMPPGTVCTESYLVVGKYSSKKQAQNTVDYLRTKFCRFLVGTILLTQNITKGKFAFVPKLSMNEPWTDEKLYSYFELSHQEITFIESVIREMDREISNH